MNEIVTLAAQYLLFVLAVVVAVAVLRAPARVRWTCIAAGLLGLALVGLMVKVSGAVHTDPRPFVVDPSLKPLFPHSPDNGFPSDHSAVAALLAVIGWRADRRVGIAVAVGAGVIAAARVLSHVHHVQDVVAGLLMGAVAGVVALAIVDAVADAWLRRRSA